jgi:hypothetical protein
MAGDTFEDPLTARLSALAMQANALVQQGMPFPFAQVQTLVTQLRDRGDVVRAEQTLERAERLLEQSLSHWKLLREQLRVLDELRALAASAGMDQGELDRRAADPRELLRTGRLSEGLLETASGQAAKSMVTITELLRRFLVPQTLGYARFIQSAENRGEEVGEAKARLERLRKSLHAGQLRGSVAAFLELREAIRQIPREPTVGLPSGEEEEILREAQSLARRISRIKSRAHNASQAARLMSEVRAALSEDRRTATPEEEIDELWDEVDRLSRERLEAELSPLRPTHPAAQLPPDIPPELLEAANGPLTPDEPPSFRRTASRRP